MMPFLRVVRQHRWIREPDDEGWPKEGELKGDALSDINTNNGKSSVYTVPSKADEQRVAVAIAATRDCFSNLDYVVFPDAGLASFGIAVQQTQGETPHREANDLHYELGKLTVSQLVKLATIISDGRHKQIPQKQIEVLLREAKKTGKLNVDDIPQKMKKRLS